MDLTLEEKVLDAIAEIGGIPGMPGFEQRMSSQLVSIADDGSLVPRPKACETCKLSHVSCGYERPCKRCIKMGRTDCADAVPKKRGRPRNDSRQARAEALAEFEANRARKAELELARRAYLKKNKRERDDVLDQQAKLKASDKASNKDIDVEKGTEKHKKKRRKDPDFEPRAKRPTRAASKASKMKEVDTPSPSMGPESPISSLSTGESSNSILLQQQISALDRCATPATPCSESLSTLQEMAFNSEMEELKGHLSTSDAKNSLKRTLEAMLELVKNSKIDSVPSINASIPILEEEARKIANINNISTNNNDSNNINNINNNINNTANNAINNNNNIINDNALDILNSFDESDALNFDHFIPSIQPTNDTSADTCDDWLSQYCDPFDTEIETTDFTQNPSTNHIDVEIADILNDPELMTSFDDSFFDSPVVPPLASNESVADMVQSVEDFLEL
ncbi:hypothetical protein BJ741DRAFT_368704 [Chytriomyces cf. hyalinus JEL632]|nr:hypothetical protein BJ741DRAFT_368704 [Chytriomyces cf. hyalinus JEL632]